MATTTTTPDDIDPSKMLGAALQYAREGWPVFPCHGVELVVDRDSLPSAEDGEMPAPKYVCRCRKGKRCDRPGKHPWTQHGFYDATTDPVQIKKWYPKFRAGANLAGRMGDGLLAIDPDLYKPAAPESLAALEAQCGELPRDWCQKTHGEGRHILLSLPAGIHVQSVEGWRNGIDTRCDGGYIMLAPSLHHSGERYEFISKFGDRAPLASRALLDQLPVFTPDPDPDPASSSSSDSTSSSSSDKPPLSEWYERPPANSAEQADDTDNSDNSDSYSIVSALSELSVSIDTRTKIMEAIDMTFPRHKGIRNGRLISLGNWLLRIEEIRDKDAEWFRPVIKLWLDRAQAFIGPRDFDDTWEEWRYIWVIWLEPSIDKHPIFKAAELMKHKPTSPIPEQGYKSDNARRLVALCAALAEVAADGDGVFYISCRDAARVLGLHPEKDCKFIASVFRRMVEDGILEKVGERKPGSMKAQRYRYHEYVVPEAETAAAAA